MDFKWNFSGFNHVVTRIIVLVVSLFTILPFDTYSNDDNYQLIKLAQLDHQLLSQPNWRKLVANPSNKLQRFVIRESGQIYLIDDDEVNPKPILDLRTFSQTSSSFFKLTAIELHPNFSLRNQIGHGIFYTAHIENSSKNSKTTRLQEEGDDLKLKFDVVITEWGFSTFNHQEVDVSTKREVLRIGVPESVMVIKQMSFNPYDKLWNDDFGLLYIALKGDSKWLQSLYSGVIIRINPTKFGLRSFSLPGDNPYMKNSQIHDAIYLLGGQKIEQFIWPDKNSEHILVSHQYNNKYLLSLATERSDWRGYLTKHVLYQSDVPVHDMLIYRGRELPSLHSKLLLLQRKEQQWFVNSLIVNFAGNKTVNDENKPKIEWKITSSQLPTDSQITLSRDYHGEIVFLEKSTSALFRLTQKKSISENIADRSGEKSMTETNSSDPNIFIVLCILFIFFILGIIYYSFKLNRLSVHTIVRQQFSSFQLSESCQQIALYHRHKSDVDTLIDVVDIVSSEIKLNECSLCIINAEVGYGFNHDQEQYLRTTFSHEKIEKMVDDKVRQVSLVLTDKKQSRYTVCLYLRKGSNRLTKNSYARVVKELIDWCWFIGEKLNTDIKQK